MTTRRYFDLVPLSELRRAPRNPKDHALEALASSMDEFGYVEPITLDDRTGRIVSGHGRLDDFLARHSDGRSPPDDSVTVDAGEWLVPVVRGWSSADDSAADGYLVAANRTAELGGWDSGLPDYLDSLVDAGVALSATGFTADDLDDLLAATANGVLAPEPFDGGYAETPEEAAARALGGGTTREARGLHELVLVFQVDAYREYRDMLARLRSAWGEDAPALVVLRALGDAVVSLTAPVPAPSVDGFTPDLPRLDDLVVFARIELDSHDLEPWAELLRALFDRGTVPDAEGLLWLVKLYNAYDSISSAWQAYRRWPTPLAWSTAPDRDEAQSYPCTQERRNLRGGRVLRHLDSYIECLAGADQVAWVDAALSGDDPESDFSALTAHLRSVWGTGRQSAFEWAEFLAKVAEFPVTAGDAQLWESEGPRRSLQRLYGNAKPDADWLDEAARRCRAHLADAGVDLAWEDLETVICDFNVARDGRYYPGRHLAALREEIEEVPEPDDRALMVEALASVIPSPWCDVAPGIDRSLLPVYRDSGVLIDRPDWQPDGPR